MAVYSNRRSAIKQLKSASGNLETTLQHLLRVKLMYQDEYPNHAKAIEAVMVVVLTSQDLLGEVIKKW